MLVDAKVLGENDSLTAGEALTATQAAIWYYGNSGSNKLVADKIVGQTYTSNGKVNTTSSDKETVQKIFDYLINQTQAPEEKTTILDENTIQESKVDFTSKNNDGTYNTNITFTLGVSKSGKDKDTLKLTLSYVGADGKTHFIAQNKSLSEFGENGNTYTFEDVTVAKGQKLTLSLTTDEGKDRELETGVYLFSSETRDLDGNPTTSQTFVGVAKGTQKVNLSVDLTFNWDDPESKMTTSNSHTDQTVKKESSTERTDIITKTDYFNEVTTTTETVDQTKWEWHSAWEKNYHHSSDDDHNADPTVTISGEKTWVYDADDDTARSLIPESITVNLLADGKLTDSTTAKADRNGDWKYSFTGLPKCDHGKEIVYTVQEVVVEGFTATYDGYNITNTYTGKTTEEEKSGDDDDNIPDGWTPSTDIPSLDIPDDVPTANVPKTGDASVIWYVLSTCSGLGLAGTALLGRKRRDEDDI